MDIQRRLAEFFRRLQAAPDAATAAEALTLVCHLMEQVEDELCPGPREEPPPLRFTGRMYAPRADRTYWQPDGSVIADARHHEIKCFPDGAIRITHKPRKALVIHKQGKVT